MNVIWTTSVGSVDRRIEFIIIVTRDNISSVLST